MNEESEGLGQDSRPVAPRIPIVESPSEAVREIYAKALANPDGNPLNIFATLAHHPDVLKRFVSYAGYFLNKGLIPEREREVVILRIGWNCRSVYEFGQHTLIGRRVGLTDDEIAALTRSPDTHPWSVRDQALIEMCDDLCRDDCVADGTWRRLTEEWSEAELIELVMVAGTYRLVSGFLNTMGVELDAGVPGWPSVAAD